MTLARVGTKLTIKDDRGVPTIYTVVTINEKDDGSRMLLTEYLDLRTGKLGRKVFQEAPNGDLSE